MKFAKLILPLTLAVSSTYAAAAYQLSVWGKNKDNRTYGYVPKGCYCRKSECERIGRSKKVSYSCIMSYECGIC